MSGARVHITHPLPAPVLHAGFSVNQSKSHVLAGVQDAYWSDDEAEDAECPLCLEEMDISDLNFKPCICGYQICRFCWHHIKENLNKRCPACRRVYSDEAVEFKPIPPQDHKRLTQQKKQRERERKELDMLGRRHLANVRVVQRNVVYILGIGPRFAKEELIPTLRSNEYFGQYGKITKILLVKRTPTGGGGSVLGLYLTYHRREDAARCISGVDGAPSPSGGREVMRASYGTTKYCMAFLRGVSCNDHNCMNFHDWGDEKDCFTKEDLTTLKHTMKTSETRSRNAATSGKKGEDSDASLPRAASWGQKAHITSSSGSSLNSGAVRQSRRSAASRQQRTTPSVLSPLTEARSAGVRTQPQESKLTTTKGSPQAPSSHFETPSLTQAKFKAELKTASIKKETAKAASLQTPTSLATFQSLVDSTAQDPVLTASSEQHPPVQPTQASVSTPMVPPGLSLPFSAPVVPPGLPSPNRSSRAATASPGTPILASQSSYQMSNAARALLDDVQARRESSMGISPFPDFDRTLQTLTEGENGSFSFNLDPKFSGKDSEDSSLPDFAAEVEIPFRGSYMDAFPALRTPSTSAAFTAPPGPSYAQHQYPNLHVFDSSVPRVSQVSTLERGASSGSSYVGSFNPFAEPNEEFSPPPGSPVQRSPYPDDDFSRKVSRFRFARGRQGSSAASPPLSNSNSEILFHSASDAHIPIHWSKRPNQDYVYAQQSSATSSPLLHHSLPSVPPQGGEFQSFGSSVTEAQLRDFIQASKDRALINSGSGRSPSSLSSNPTQFSDPAIVSSFTPPTSIVTYNRSSYGPPPGLSFSHPGAQVIPASAPFPAGTESNGSTHASLAASPAPSLTLSPSDFPALPSTSSTNPANVLTSPATKILESKAQEKPARKAAKKVSAAAEKAAGRQKLAEERAALKAAERAKLAQEKQAEERVIALMTQEKAAKDLAEKEKPDEKLAEEPRIEAPSIASHGKDSNSVGKKAPAKQVEATQPKKTMISLKPAMTLKPLHEPALQVPLLSKKPKKNKSILKPIKEDTVSHEDTSSIPSVSASDGPLLPTDTNFNDSRSHSWDRGAPTSIEELLEEIDLLNPMMDLPTHPFFDAHKLNPASSMPLEYGPLVHALSALSVGGGSFAGNMPPGSIDNAVSSFQQLLETLTQTISDLLRLLPRTTWDDSSSFDGVLREMLKGDDFLDDTGDEGRGKEDEVAALTLALERRARWMEVQLSKLEELHRDINMAAVRAVLSFNDNGWDRHAALPRTGNSLRRFDSIGLVEENGVVRSMNSSELEQKLAVAKEAAVFAESQVREAMERIQSVRPVGSEL